MGAFLRHALRRRRHGSAPSDAARAAFRLTRALLHAGCASSKLEDARERRLVLLLEQNWAPSSQRDAPSSPWNLALSHTGRLMSYMQSSVSLRRLACSEFPNDNPQLHHGALWVPLAIGEAPSCVFPS